MVSAARIAGRAFLLAAVFYVQLLLLRDVLQMHVPLHLLTVGKLLPIVCLVGMVLLFEPQKQLRRAAVLTGLLLSGLGDYLLTSDDNFLAGLVAFLVAHLFYIAAFGVSFGRLLLLRTAVPFYAFGYAVFWLYLLPNLAEAEVVPVAVYIGVICTTGWRAAAAVGAGPRQRRTEQWIGVAGAVLFMVSDLTLAWNRFVSPFLLGNIMCISTYYAGQAGIAYSVVYAEMFAQDPKVGKRN